MRYHTTTVGRAIWGPSGGRNRGSSLAVATHHCEGDVGTRTGAESVRAAGYLNS